MREKTFPSDFLWGAATASYQIEGAYNEGGRGESIWDRFCSVPGNVLNGHTGNIACDHYHRYKEDVALMKEMGLKAYRFSISWSRILPKGTGKVNKAGLEFYSKVIDELLKAQIEPCITLYHWDLPQALQDKGGWANPDMPKYFLDYAKIVFSAYGDRVTKWITLNEPYCAAFLGNYIGRQAPGLKDFSTALAVSYNLYVGHGLAVEYFRSQSSLGEIGIALNLMGRHPFTDSSEDKAAAYIADGYLNRWFIEPLVYGEYPKDMIDFYEMKGVVLPEFQDKDLQLISQSLDFIGLNYYNDFHVKFDKTIWPLELSVENRPFVPTNNRGWPVTEDGLESMLVRLKNEYGIDSIYITENGTSCDDIVSINGTIEDSLRIDYLQRHLISLHNAIEKGVGVKGYFQWSLYDNFEWAFGYSSRFGIVYVDFETQKRIVKNSGHWYSRVIKNNQVDGV